MVFVTESRDGNLWWVWAKPREATRVTESRDGNLWWVWAKPREATVLSPSSFVFSERETLWEHPELVLFKMYLQEDPKSIPQDLAIRTARWIEQTNQLAEEERRLYRDIIRCSVTKGTRILVENAMSVQEQKYQHHLFRKAYGDGLSEGREAGIVEGRQEGREEGREAGIVEGHERGVVQATIQSLYAVLESRDLTVDSSQRARIDECNDEETLQRWVRQAATAKSTEVALR